MIKQEKTFNHLLLAIIINIVFLIGLAHLTRIKHEHSPHAKTSIFTISTTIGGHLLNTREQDVPFQETIVQPEAFKFPELEIPQVYPTYQIPELNIETLNLDKPETHISVPSFDIKHVMVKKIASRKRHSLHSSTTSSKNLGEKQANIGSSKTTGTGSSRGIFGLQEVDIPPKIVKKAIPLYPIKARRLGIEGTLVVKFLVDIDGRVKNIKIVSAQPKGFFEKTVFDSLKKWRFVPGKKGGRIVKTVMILPIQFKLKN